MLIVVPFTGVPILWKYIIIILIGLFLIILAYTRNARRKFHKVYSTKTYTESVPETIETTANEIADSL
jgi:Tfp pilus assembly protein PilO